MTDEYSELHVDTTVSPTKGLNAPYEWFNETLDCRAEATRVDDG